jgi:hypothetical protein
MAATFPMALKVFSTFHDYTDVIWAYSVNEIHDEIVAIESVLGTTPFVGTPYTSFAGAIQDLYANKAPVLHTHVHSTLIGDNVGNDHPQYMQVTGYPGFSRPVAGQNATALNDLATIGQLLSFGWQTAAQVEAAVENATQYLMCGAYGGPPLAGPAVAPNFIVQGGMADGCTDDNGQIFVPFKTVLGTVQSFVCTKLPPETGLGAPPVPCPPYNWIEAQVTLVGCSGYGAVVQFSHDYSWQPNMHVTLTWIAIGMSN